jgi:ferrous iron transport protein A
LAALQCRLKESYTKVRPIRSQFYASLMIGELGRNAGVLRLRVLSELEVGETGVLVALDLPPGVQNHLMYMGFVPDARVKALHRAPAGDPTVYSVDGIEIALRRETARAIRVASIPVGDQAVPVAVENSPIEPVEELTEAIQ